MAGRSLTPSLAVLQVWTAARAATSEGRETGAIARLHGALMGVLTHLVDRLGLLATGHPSVSQVLLPLLAHGLDLGNPEADTLTEDALKLLLVALGSGGGLSPGLQVLHCFQLYQIAAKLALWVGLINNGNSIWFVIWVSTKIGCWAE